MRVKNNEKQKYTIDELRGASVFYVAICDNDKSFIEYIKKVIIKSGIHKNEITFYEYYSEEEFLFEIEKGVELDILILDMQTEGNKVAIQFRKRYSNTILIFCSRINKLSPESLKVSPFRFLFKEYSDKRMLSEFTEIVGYMKEKKKKPMICGHNRYNHFQVGLDDVMYISIARRGSEVHISEEEKIFYCKKKVEELYEILKEYDFVYVHNSYIVNLKYIKKRTKDEIQLMDGEILSVSRARTKELREKMILYLEKKFE